MKLELKQLLIAVGALKTLGDDRSLNVKTKHTIARNIRLIQPELDQYEKERIDLVQNKYGVIADDGNVSVLPERMKEFLGELVDLQSAEVDLDICKVGEDACANLSSNEISLLDWMLESGE